MIRTRRIPGIGRGAARLGLLLLGLALAGCGSPQLPCPAPLILRDADRVVKLAPGGAPQYVGEIDDAKLNCSYDPNTAERLEVNMGVRISAQKPASSPAAAADLKYFVAIVNLQGELLARKEFPLTLSFPPGSDRASKIEQIYQVIPVKPPQNGGSLQIWVGFQLSDAELQYNRAHPGS